VVYEVGDRTLVLEAGEVPAGVADEIITLVKGVG
jgi:hypothetical protein